MARVYSPKEIDTSVLKDKVIASIGYGYQGRRYSMNIKKHGFNVIVGNIQDEYYDQAVADGMEVYTIEEATKKADIVMMQTGDEAQPKIYTESIHNKLRKGKALVFLSGFNIYHGFIHPAEHYDVILVAPVTPTVIAVGVENNFSGKAWEIALALAKICKIPFHFAIESSFAEEIIADDFHSMTSVDQAVKLATFDILVEAGYSPEMAYFQTIGWITARTEEAFQKRGCDGVVKRFNMTSNTANFDKMIYTNKLIDEDFKKKMKEYLRKVEHGENAKEWMIENSLGRPVLNHHIKKFLAHPALAIEKRMLAKRNEIMENEEI